MLNSRALKAGVEDLVWNWDEGSTRQLGSGRHRLMMPPALSALGPLLHDAVSGGSVRLNAQRQEEEGALDLSPMSF